MRTDESSRHLTAAPILGVTLNNMPSRVSRAAPTPPVVARYTEESVEFQEAYEMARMDLERVDSVPLLTGPSDYHDWLRDFQIVCRQICVIDFFEGQEDQPLPPEAGEDAPVEEYNEYMLQLADWTGMNDSILECIRITRNPLMRSKILTDVSTVSAARAILREACKPTFGLVMSLWRRLHEYTLDQAPDFLSFRYEFENRFEAFNRLEGGIVLDDNHKSLFFLCALGPGFSSWINTLNQVYRIAGCGYGSTKDLTFHDLSSYAENYWHSIQRSKDTDLEMRAHRSSSSVASRKRTFDHRNGDGRPPFGVLLGPPDRPCQWPGHNGTGERGHTNGMCMKQNNDLYREFKKRSSNGHFAAPYEGSPRFRGTSTF